jgi:hypothetical protein
MCGQILRLEIAKPDRHLIKTMSPQGPVLKCRKINIFQNTSQTALLETAKPNRHLGPIWDCI